MKTKRMLFEKLCFILPMILLLPNSVESEDNEVQKLTRCRENERQALLEFKAGLFDGHRMLPSWENNNNNCCDWRGIHCNKLTGHVTLLNLPGNMDNESRLFGKISPSLSELKNLIYLNLSRNSFIGKIPPQLGNLTNLRALDLRSNYELKAENLDWLSRLHLLTHLDLSRVNLISCRNWLNQINKLSSLTHLLLSGTRLPDPLIPVNTTSFSAFNSLAVVDLSQNNFSSPKSYDWLFNFTTSLVDLDLTMNSFPQSEIPEGIGRIISLESLRLIYCDLGGMLRDSFMNLSRLSILDLTGNYFKGSLSKFLRPLAIKENNSLQVLILKGNQLGGSLPDYFEKFLALLEIKIRGNNISGIFPDNFWQLSFSLVHLDLSKNQLTGPLPNLTLFSSLETLYLGDNKLEGTVPEAYFSNLSKLIYLDLSSNSLFLNFSSDWVPPFQLYSILLRNCTLGPSFPNWIKSQQNFSVLDISYASIRDTVPIWFWDHLPPVLQSLSLSYNNLEGILPDLSQKFNSSLETSFDVRSNCLSGPIPSIPTNIVTLDLSHNRFSGSLSFLCTTPYKTLGEIDLSDNQLSDVLPDCFMNVPNLSVLILAKNNLSGTIPTSIALLDQLEALQLRKNNFSGELPSFLKNCTRLAFLDLSENKLSGDVQTWIGKYLTSLVVFSLRNNQFSGMLPSEICHLRDAQVLDFAQNNFSGSIPNCINNITSLTEYGPKYSVSVEEGMTESSTDTTFYTNAVVQWKGVASEYRNTLSLLKLIDLSSNRLMGEIPKEFASLKELISLNLSHNRLTGNIIQEIGEMNSLEVLDLSRNQLSGKIPGSLASLTLLSVLNLSNNNLSGQIPRSTQLQTFNTSTYGGNELLCGLPLAKCDNLVSNPIGRDKEDGSNKGDEDRLSKIWLYAIVIFGFAFGFWGFIGPIMLRRTQRHDYYRLLDKVADHMYVTTTLNLPRLQRKIYR